MTHVCKHPACGCVIKRERFACSKHWFMLSAAIRNRVNRAWRDYLRDERAAVGALRAAQGEALKYWEAHP